MCLTVESNPLKRCTPAEIWRIDAQKNNGLEHVSPFKYSYSGSLPAPSKGCQLNPKGWWIDTLYEPFGTLWKVQVCCSFFFWGVCVDIVIVFFSAANGMDQVMGGCNLATPKEKKQRAKSKWYRWWFRNPANQLRFVVFLIIYKVLAPSRVVIARFLVAINSMFGRDTQVEFSSGLGMLGCEGLSSFPRMPGTHFDF